jgi:O-antigen/teichoic acid export membrane protein
MLSGYFAIALAIVINILLIPTILSNVGKELYGLWLLIFNIISYFYLADFGITNAITRLYAKYQIIGQEKVNKLLSSSYLIVLILDIVIISTLLIFKTNIANYLEVKDQNLEIFLVLFLIAIFELFTQFILRVNFGILRGKHKYNIAYNLEALTSILRIVSLGVLLYIDDFTIINFAFLYSFSKIFSDSLSFFYISDNFKRSIPLIDHSVLKELIDNSTSTLITSISATVYNALPILLFGKIFGINQVFLYSIPFAVMIMLSRLLNVMFAGFTPRAAELKAIKNENEIREISSYAVKIVLLLTLSLLTFIIVFGYYIFKLWLGIGGVLNAEELLIIYNIFVLLLIFLTIANLQNANIVIYQAAGFHWYVTFETVLSAILLLCLSMFFIDLFNLYAFAVAMLFVGVFKYLYYKFSKKSKFKTYSISTSTFALLALFIVLIYYANSTLDTVLPKLILFITSLLFISAFVYFGLFNANEKLQIQTQIKKLKWKL